MRWADNVFRWQERRHPTQHSGWQRRRIASSGEAGIAGRDPVEVGPLRQDEEGRSAALVGVSDVLFLGQPDGMIEYGLALRRDLARVFRQLQPRLRLLVVAVVSRGLPGAAESR